MKSNKIHYGFGKDYLPNWGLKEALREVYQNFIDYGEYEESLELVAPESTDKEDMIQVVISNDWIPENLEFLRIGRSVKQGLNSIGKHGEGLKMAFLIFERLGYYSEIQTPEFNITPEFHSDENIGEVFLLNYEKHDDWITGFRILFKIPKNDFDEFRSNIIQPEDIIFNHPNYGCLVDKPNGNIYSGGLFVANIPNIGRAYDINPEHLPLDRDRCAPGTWDTNWATSKILEAHGKWSSKDLSFSDTIYIDTLPEESKHHFTPILVGDEIEVVYKTEDGQQKMVKNDRIKEMIHKDSYFASAIKKLKVFVMKKMGLYDMLLEFKAKHIHSEQARLDFDLILERVEK